MVTNQDGLGTKSFPEDDFWPTHNFLLKAFENEGIVFDEILIDKAFQKTMRQHVNRVQVYLHITSMEILI